MQEGNKATTATSSAGGDDGFSVATPQVSLPKGGGAIRGIGEKFAANPVTGTGSMSVPIATSPGRAGFGPQLSLNYDSGSGNGPFGYGWSLSLPSITRKTDKGLPRYIDVEESDVFILSGVEDLVPMLDADGKRAIDLDTAPGYIIHRYQPRIEGSFTRIERWTRRSDDDVHWRSITRDNILTTYGKDEHSRIHDPEDSHRIFSWMICETRDDKGNAILYKYKTDNGAGVELTHAHERNRGIHKDPQRSTNLYLKRILYGNRSTLILDGRRPSELNAMQLRDTEWMFEVVFDYGEHDEEAPAPSEAKSWKFRKDPFSTYRAGFEVRTTRLCQRVLMFHHLADVAEGDTAYDGLVRSTEFTYSHEQEPASARNPVYTFLHQVAHVAHLRRDGGGYDKRSLPPVGLTYSQPQVQSTVHDVAPQSLENLPLGLDGSTYQWIDLHGEGIPGILSEQNNNWYYKRNLSPINEHVVDGSTRTFAKFAPLETVTLKPNLALAAGAQVMELAGDGLPDLAMLHGPLSGFYEHDLDQGWEPFRPLPSRLTRSIHEPNLKFIDLDGNGQADILVSEDDAFIWHASLAEAGFGPAQRIVQSLNEETGPRLVFSDGTQSIYLADMCGDGLTDLVRIRNGEICYWPNVGYGRFGSKVSMDYAPHFDTPDQFDQQRIRVADIDGTGTNDILYLHRDGVRLYFNQSGNSWSKALKSVAFPQVDNVTSIMTADLLGNGTACLIWSSPLSGNARRQMRYVNLMGGQKPHLLIKTTNNLGAESEVQYAPSTKFYLADKLAGKPWITKLPFPVHVVERVTVRDKWRGTIFSSRYSYHHGYFDGSEREFRGFGRVEQIDVEDFGTFLSGNSTSPYITQDLELYQPPVKTITWFHTGVYLERARILSQYQDEYFQGFAERTLPQPDLANEDLTHEEWREALRACKGMMMRQEVYELDVDAIARGEHLPVRLFNTTHHNCRIHRLQPRADNRHAVFLVTESEALTYQYELNLRDPSITPDPRISHLLNLHIDELGNVLQTVVVAYPRRVEFGDSSLDVDDVARIRAVQSERHVAYTETRYTNDVNSNETYRLRVPCEVKAYELTGIVPGNGTVDEYFSLDQLRGFELHPDYQPGGTLVGDVSYHEQPPTGPHRRCIEHVRTLFFVDNSALPEFLQSPLPFETQGALGLPYETYKLALTETLAEAVFGDKLTPEVRAALADPLRSGYAHDAMTGEYWVRSGIAGFEPDASAHFFMPERYTDPFGHTTTLVYDDRDLFIRLSTDPLGNTVTVTDFDHRVLAPSGLRDINDNLTQSAFNVLGLPAAEAILGKGHEGDSLAELTPSLIDPEAGDRAAYFTDTYDEATSRHLLAGATLRHIYYFGEEFDADGNITGWSAHPPGAAAILRETHVAEERRVGRISELQVAFEYSDGSGNVLVNKVQAEPANGDTALRWIASGKTVLNNKGKPVKQYEPYWSDTEQRFDVTESERGVGVTPLLYYDAVSRLVRTELPDGTLSRVEHTPWKVLSFDPNDTVNEDDNAWLARRNTAIASVEERRAARLASEHAGTPAEVILDSLGREVISIAHNRPRNEAGALIEEKYLTFTKLDAEGKPLWIRDARRNLVMQYITPPKPTTWLADSNENILVGTVPCYDIVGNLLFQHSMDGGDRWMITDATGQPFYAWDINESVTDGGTLGPQELRMFHTTYDNLHRPTEQRLSIDNGDPQTVERFEYGEKHVDALSRNLRGQVYRHYDPSGLNTNQYFNFKGNVLEVTRQFASAFEAPIIHWPESPPQAALEEESFTQITDYDALSRMVRLYNWHRGLGSRVAIYEPRYNQRGVLMAEDLVIGATKTAVGFDPERPAPDGLPATRTPAIRQISYDAKGLRTSISYGNGTTTQYTYDDESFRLIRLYTSRSSDSTALQDLRYTYDPVGNITAIHDHAQQTVYFANAVVDAHNSYEYDALYRLTSATGREHTVQNNVQRDNHSFVPEIGIPFANSPGALQNYKEHYAYDAVGNILSMSHSGGAILRWKRCYQYALDSNRLLGTGKPSELVAPEVPCPNYYVETPTLSVGYTYDTHGSILDLHRSGEKHSMRRDYRDMIQHANLGGGGNAWYNYDSEKERTRKRIQRDGNLVEERFYLSGMEWYRRFRPLTGEILEEIETSHIFVDNYRVLIVEDVIKTNSTQLESGVLFRYQHGNHLGSVGLEIDEAANAISYEEYHPYGTTAYRASSSETRAAKKRYRYTGMERDEETGLCYHSARYFLPWLGRWGNADPTGIGDGANLYAYVKNRPIKLVDQNGENGIALGYTWEGSNFSSTNWSPVGDLEIAENQLEKIKTAFRAIGEIQAAELGLTGDEREIFINAEADSLSIDEERGEYFLSLDIENAINQRGAVGTSWVFDRLNELSISDTTTRVGFGEHSSGFLGFTHAFDTEILDANNNWRNVGGTSENVFVGARTSSRFGGDRSDLDVGFTLLHELGIHAWRDATFLPLSDRRLVTGHSPTGGHALGGPPILTADHNIRETHNLSDIEAELLSFYFYTASGIDISSITNVPSDEGGIPTILQSVQGLGGILAPNLERFQDSRFVRTSQRYASEHRNSLNSFLYSVRRNTGNQSIRQRVRR